MTKNSNVTTANGAAQVVTDDMRSAVRYAPSSAYWSQRLREIFGPDARDGIDALEAKLRDAMAAQQEAPAAQPLTDEQQDALAWLKSEAEKEDYFGRKNTSRLLNCAANLIETLADHGIKRAATPTPEAS